MGRLESLAIVGGGEITSRRIIPALRALGYPASSVTVLDVAAARLLPRAHADLIVLPPREISAWLRQNRQPAIIATPTSSHLEYLQELAPAGLPIAVEKPLCATETELGLLAADSHLMDRSFALGYYALDKALPLTYLVTLIPSYRKFLQRRDGPRLPDADQLAGVMPRLGRPRRLDVRLIEGAERSPAGLTRHWTETPAALSTFVDTALHPLHLAAIALGSDNDLAPSAIELGFDVDRARQVRQLTSGRDTRIAPTLLDLSADCAGVDVRVVVGKHAPPRSIARTLSITYDSGTILVDLDQRRLATFLGDQLVLDLEVGGAWRSYMPQLEMFSAMASSGWPEGRTDALTAQLAALRWWHELCRAASTEPVREVRSSEDLNRPPFSAAEFWSAWKDHG